MQNNRYKYSFVWCFFIFPEIMFVYTFMLGFNFKIETYRSLTDMWLDKMTGVHAS
jgi:hypothetical protein